MPNFKFEHVHLTSPDPSKTVEFYEKMFGATKGQEMQMPGGGSIIFLNFHGTNIIVSPASDKPPGFPKGPRRRTPRSPAAKAARSTGPKPTAPRPSRNLTKSLTFRCPTSATNVVGMYRRITSINSTRWRFPVSPSFGVSTFTSGGANNVGDAFSRGTSCRPPRPSGPPRRSWAPICRR